MTLRRILRLYLALQALLLGALAGTPASGMTQYKGKRKPFYFSTTSFKTDFALPVKDEIITVKMSDSIMQQRLEQSLTDETVEPLTVLLTDDPTGVTALAEKIGLAGKVDDLAGYLKQKLKAAKPLKPGGQAKSVEINAEGFALIDRGAFADLYSKTHHNLTVDSDALKRDPAARRELMRQLTPFFKKSQRQAILSKINKGTPLKVDDTLLPDFPKKMVRKYITHRGPNCFHAALAFQGTALTSSSMINVKDETGYHRAMINYDELWRVLSQNFYEVDPEKQPLKYGDMLVFFDVPKKDADNLEAPVDYRWIRHTATYLFGGYTFSKGSKSPNTPYTVRTLPEEWSTWKRYTKNLGVKVLRRSQKSVKATPPLDLTDWIY